MSDDAVCDPLGSVVPSMRRPVAIDQKLRRAHKLEAFGQFACGVAHDVNNMLLVINGYSEMLSKRVADHAVRADVQEILSAGERAAKLTGQVLAFCREAQPCQSLLNLSDVVQGVEAMLRVLVGSQVDVTTVLSPAIESVLADRAELEQIVVNLAINARAAMPDGGLLQVETAAVSCAADGDDAETEPARTFVRLRIRDTGVGMDEQTRQRIFEPFFTTKPPGEGTGLGLAIVRANVERCGGHLVVTSAPGAGSTFNVYLPTWRGGRPSPG